MMSFEVSTAVNTDRMVELQQQIHLGLSVFRISVYDEIAKHINDEMALNFFPTP